MTWNNVFGANTVQPTQSTVATYTITSSPFQLNWAWDSETNQVCTFTNLTTALTNEIVKLPSVLNEAVGYSFQLKNIGNNALLIRAYDNSTLFTLGTGNIVTMVIKDSTSDATGWQFNQLNVTVQTTVNPANIAGSGLSLDVDNKLFPQDVFIDVDLSSYPSNTLTLTDIVPNASYIIRPAGGTIILPDAITSDIGSLVTFKNSANGSVFIQTDTANGYYIDINTTVVGGLYGYSEVSIAPNEAVTIEYTGPTVSTIPPYSFNMYYTTAKVNQVSNLLSEATLVLPATPGSAISLGAQTLVSDVINFDGVTNSATGSYTYNAPYPVNKVYYVTLQTNQTGAAIPTIVLNFGAGGAGKQLTMNESLLFALIYVSPTGNVNIFGATYNFTGQIAAYSVVGNNTASPSVPFAFPFSALSVLHGQQLITASGNFTVPDFVTEIFVSACGGGGGGGGPYPSGGPATGVNAGVGGSTIVGALVTLAGGQPGSNSGIGGISPSGTSSNGQNGFTSVAPIAPAPVGITLGGSGGGSLFGSGGNCRSDGSNGSGYGSGGAGGGSSTAGDTGGGGGSGAVCTLSQAFTVTPGQVIAITIGAGGTAGSAGGYGGGVGAPGMVFIQW